MARFNVTAPDGSIIPVDAPDGATEQDAIAFAAATFKPAQAPAQTEVPGPRQRPSALTQLGRSAASLADVTVGGVIPAVVQQVGYGLARLNRSPEQAQAATARLVGAVESPFGRAFGVTETPEYQQEAGRQVLDFIGQNFQKGAKWIAGKTGLPQSDIENYLGTATLAAPAVARPVARTVQQTVAPAIEKAVIGAKMPFEARAQAKRERQSLEDYARGPQIDAAADAQRLGIVLNPTDIQSTVGTRLTAMAAGPRAPEALANANKNQVRTVALGDMDLPLTTQLNSPKAFQQARTQVAAPYEQVKKLPIQQADDAMVQRLEALRADLDVIGAKEYAPAISKIVDDAIAKTQTGLTGEQLLKNISVLRERARKTYNNKSATTEALDVADTNLKVATELESMIDGSIFNPKLLSEFRDARQKMARTYAYEGATDLNTGMVDVGKLARITSKDNALTGDIASLGKIAGNFPDVFSAQPTPGFFSAPRLSRSGAGGAAGALVGSQFGLTGSILGGVLGGAAGEATSALAARRIASPGYQAGLNLRDARIPVNQLAASMQPIPQSQAIVPYQAPVEVLGQGQGTYFPNFEMRGEGRAANRVVWDPATKTYRAEFAPEVTPMAPEAPLNRLAYDPNVPVQGQPGVFDIMRQRERDLSMRQGMAAEQQAAAAEAAARQPTRGAVEMQINPLTGLPEIATGIKGATPATFQDFGSTLKSATDKATAGRMFDLTAAEKVAFDKTRVDLAEAVPGMKSLSDKAVAAKMQDRAWVQDAVGKAQERARAFEAIAARADTERARQSALANRERMLDLAEQMEDMLRPGRPVKTGGQGPKTRAFQRNMLTPEQEIQNALSR
jgi:hypothetical protein